MVAEPARSSRSLGVESLKQIVGTNVRLGRERMGLTQEDLAALAEIDLSNLSRMERGKANPSVDMFGKLAKARGTTPAALLTDGSQ